MKLNAKKIDAAKPDPKKIKRLADGDGLYLKIHTSGTKTFVYRYTYGRKREEVTLGTYPALGLADARERKNEQKALVESHKSPKLVKHSVVETKRNALTLAEAVERFHHEWLANPALSGYKDPKGAHDRLVRDPVRELGSMLIVDVRPEHLTGVFNKMSRRGVKVAPKRTLAITKKFFHWALVQHLIDADPCEKIMPKDVGAPERSKKRNLLLEQIAEALDLLNSDEIGMHLQTRLGIKLILATAKRAGEVVTIEDEHYDLQRREWLNPAHLTKEQHGDHKVFLNDYAVKIIRQLQKLRPPGSKYLFPHLRGTGGKPHAKPHIDPRTLSNAINDLFKAGKLTVKWTPHNLRHTFSSRMGDLGVPPYVSEKCLDHLMTGTMGVYNVASYFPERRQAMDLWGKTLEQLDMVPELDKSMTYLKGRASRGSGAFEERRSKARQLRAQRESWARIAQELGYPSAAAARMAVVREG